MDGVKPWRAFPVTLALGRPFALGGIETHMTTLARFLVRRGHPVTLLIARGDNEPLLSSVAEAGVLVVEIPVRHWRAHVQSTRPVIVHAHCHQSSRVMARACAQLDVPLVITLHGPLQQLPALNQPQPDGQRMCERVGVICVSEEIRKGLGVPEFPCTVIENGVDLDLFHPVKKPPTPPWRVTYVGRVGPSKQAGLRALQQAIGTMPDVRISYASTWHPSSPATPTLHVAPLLQQSHVTFATGRGVQEGMACGNAVFVLGVTWDGLVTSDNVRALSRFNFSGRATAAPPTPATLRTEFIRLISHRRAYETARRFGPRIVRKRWDAATMTADTIRFYRQLLTNYGKPTAPFPGLSPT